MFLAAVSKKVSPVTLLQSQNVCPCMMMGPPHRQMVPPQSAPPHGLQQSNFNLLQSPPSAPHQQQSAPNSAPGTPVRMQHFVVNNVNHLPPQQQQQQPRPHQPHSYAPGPSGVRMVQQQPIIVNMAPAINNNGVVLSQPVGHVNMIQQPRMMSPLRGAVHTGGATAKPLHVQRLEAMLDVNPFLDQLERLLSSPIRIPNRSLAPASGSNPPHPPPNSVFSVKGIWSSEQERREQLCKLYNFNTLSKRKWLKDVLLEESDSDSDGDQSIPDSDLAILLKIHKCRRKYQKKYHTDIMNSQYTYYGGGLLSEVDRFPSHQQYIVGEYGYGVTEHGDDEGVNKASTSSFINRAAPPRPLQQYRGTQPGGPLRGFTSRPTSATMSNTSSPMPTPVKIEPVLSPLSLKVEENRVEGRPTIPMTAMDAKPSPILSMPPIEDVLFEQKPEQVHSPPHEAMTPTNNPMTPLLDG